MKALLSIILSFFLLTVSCGIPASLTGSPKMPEGTDKIDGDYAGIVKFGASFAEKAAASVGTDKNVVVSPLSAYIALAMCREGAAGDTRAELDALLGDVSGEQLLALSAYLTSRERTELAIANSVWFDETVKPADGFLSVMGDSYRSEVFKTKLSRAKDAMNAWIEDNTDGMIRDMIDDDFLEGTLVALINTVYMNAQWEQQFDAASNRKWLFNNADGSVTETDFMFAKGTRRVVETSDYLGVVLPYSDGALEFIALMPKDDSMTTAELTALVSDAGGFAAASVDYKNESVKLTFPKFEQEFAAELNEILADMGVSIAFSGAADFSAMCSPSMCIGTVLQNAVIKVDEKGTEAAAATVVGMKATSAFIENQREITFDVPFVFAVYDNASGAVLFSGARNTAK